MFMLYKSAVVHESKHGTSVHYGSTVLTNVQLTNPQTEYFMVPVVDENGDEIVPENGTEIYTIELMYSVCGEHPIMYLSMPIVAVQSEEQAHKLADELVNTIKETGKVHLQFGNFSYESELMSRDGLCFHTVLVDKAQVNFKEEQNGEANHH